MKHIIGIGIVVIAAASHGQMFKPSKNDQLKAGKEYADKLRKEEKILPSSDPRVILIRDIGRRLLATRTPREISREPWQFTFDVIDSKEVNAFALPGGPVFFYTGLINKVTTVDELAGIMGHELIHVRREHWASAVNAQQERSAGIMILGSIFGASRQTVDMAQIIAQVGVNLPASRGQEKESDDHGFDMMLKAGYNPEGMIKIFQMFRDLKGSGAGVEFLSTHPDDKARISKLQNKIVDYKKKGKITTLPPMKTLPFETEAMRAKPKTGTSKVS